MKVLSFLVILCVLIPLVGCGSPPEYTPPPEYIPNESPKYTVDEVATGIHTEINNIRIEHGLEPLAIDPFLASLAQEHSDSMATYAHLSHERVLGERDLSTGQQPGTVRGENISMTPQRRYIPGPYLSLEEVVGWIVSGWMGSPGHKANILDLRFTQTGVGVSLKGGYLYITQDFEGRL